MVVEAKMTFIAISHNNDGEEKEEDKEAEKDKLL
jgi:hypothetical protein